MPLSISNLASRCATDGSGGIATVDLTITKSSFSKTTYGCFSLQTQSGAYVQGRSDYPIDGSNGTASQPQRFEGLTDGTYTLTLKEYDENRRVIDSRTAPFTISCPVVPLTGDILDHGAATATGGGTIKVQASGGYPPLQAVIVELPNLPALPLTAGQPADFLNVPGRAADYTVRISDSKRLYPQEINKPVNIAPYVAPVITRCDLALATLEGKPPTSYRQADGKVTGRITGAGGAIVRVQLVQDGQVLYSQNFRETGASAADYAFEIPAVLPGYYVVVAGTNPTASYGTLLDATNCDCFFPRNTTVIPAVSVPPPDLAIGDQLTFLPWLQPTLMNAASVAAGHQRPTLALSGQLQIDRGSTVSLATTTAEIYGPGDVLGLNQRAILGTTPGPGTTGFSPLQLAAIELQEEDLPWRYSTRKLADGTPLPWLFVLVLAEGEYTKLDQGSRPLPSVLVKATGAYPVAATAPPALWAHVQVNTSLGTPPPVTYPPTKLNPPSGSDIEDFLTETLPAHPELAYSRVVSPRRLAPDTSYRAFVLPATEAGRLAGLGLPFASADTDAASYPGKAVLPDTFPIYFEWTFTTGAADDFETLARQLHQANDSTRAAAPATLGLATAGTTYALPMPALLADADAPAPDAAPVPYPVANALWQRLAPTFTAGLPTALRPLVAPPLYGRAYMVSTTLAAPADPTGLVAPGPVIAPSWKHQLNLDPRYRALAAAGAQLVQANQEDYVRRAWDQVQDVLLANDKLRGAQYGLRTTAGLRDQHLPLLTTTATPTTGATPPGGTPLTAPMARFSRAASLSEDADTTASQLTASAVAAESSLDEASPAAPAGAAPASPGLTLADYGLHLTGLSLGRIRVKKASATDQAPRLTLRETIRQSSTPLAAFSPAFRRINNPYGKYQGAQAGRPLRATQVPPALDLAQPEALTTRGTSLRQRDGLLRHLTTGAIAAAAPRPDEVRANQFEDTVVDRLLRSNETALAPSPTSPLAGNDKALARFQKAYQSLRNDVPRRTAEQLAGYEAANEALLGFKKVQRQRRPLDLDALKADVIAGTQPGPVFTVRVQQVAPQLPAPAAPGQGDFEAPDFNASHFYVGDFDEPVVADWLDSDFSPADFNAGPYVARDDQDTPPIIAARRLARTAEADFGAAATASQEQAAPASLTTATTTAITASLTTGPAPIIHTDAALPAIKLAKVFPVFKDAMGEALHRRHPELFVPGLSEFPQGGLAVLEVNQAFIEAYMVGLNHALGSELRWRGFPVEPRATFFQQFWDVSEHVNSQLDPTGTATADADLESKLLDIKPIDKWIGSELGANAIDQSEFGNDQLRLALRSELLRRYPNLVIGLQPSMRDPDSGLPVPDTNPDRLLLPRQRLAVGQDLAVVCFDLSLADASAPADASTGLGAYYLVLMERPGQPRFGLDKEVPAGTVALTNPTRWPDPLNWDDLSWQYTGTPVGGNLAVDATARPHAANEPLRQTRFTDSAVAAYALFQEPVLLVVPVHGLLA